MFLDGFNFRRFLEDCYSENNRRMSAFEPPLLRPSFMPQLVDAALRALRLWNARANLRLGFGGVPASGQAGGRTYRDDDRSPPSRAA
jgi:hypothetical protein